MKIVLSLLVLLAVGIGCARVSVQAPKDPIKIDISMRLDIYQHIESDIDKIENMVTGAPAAKSPRSSLSLFVTEAYAADGLSPEVEAAALRRKDRYAQVSSAQAQGLVGENHLGLLEIRKVGAKPGPWVDAENNDRMVIYQAVAKKNGSSVEEVQKLYAKRLQADAPSGTPIEISGQGWTIKP